MAYKDIIVPGEVPKSGAIFMSNIGTKKECFRQKLFGLPLAMSNFVLHVKKGMILFLFEFERRQLYGVFRATSDGEINIVPNAFKSSGKYFPAQVRFTSVWNCSPLAEHEFQDAIRDNYFSGKKFNFGLSEDQVHRLMMLFCTKRILRKHPVRNCWRYGDKPSDGYGRFDDHRNNMIRDRIGLISKEDYHDLDISECLDDEVKEVDDRVYLNGSFVENSDNFSYDRRQGDRAVTVERPQKGNGDRFLTNFMTQNDDFHVHGTRHDILGKDLDHSLGGIRRVAEAGLHFMHDVSDGHNNLREIGGTTDEDRLFMIEKMKDEHDIEVGYRHIFTEPRGEHFGKLGVASNDAKFLMDGIANKSDDFMDNNRIQDEYHVINCSWQNISAQNLGSPCDRESLRLNDGRFFGYESELRTLNEHPPIKPKGDVWITSNCDECSTFRPRTLTDHPPFKPRAAGIEPRDHMFVAPTTHDSIRGVVLPDYIPLSHCNSSNSAGSPISEALDSSMSEQLQHPFEFSNIGKTYDRGASFSTPCDTRMIRMHSPYDPEFPDVRLRPSYFAAGPSSSPVDNCHFDRSSNEICASLSMSKTLPYDSQNQASMRYSDDPGYASMSKSHHTVSCRETRVNHIVERNWVYKTDSREGSQGPFFSEGPSLSLTGVETAELDIKDHRSHGFSSGMGPFSSYDNRHLGEPRSKDMHMVSESSNAYKKLFPCDAGLCPDKEIPTHFDKKSCQRENKHRDITDKRVSVFARLTVAPEAVRHEQELHTNGRDLDASVNKVMKMLEKVVSSPTKRTGKSISAFVQDDDDKIVDHELPKVKIEPDVDLANETLKGESMLQETRLVDFKRRKKANKSLDDKSKENSAGQVECETSAGNTASECLAGTASDVGSVEINSLVGMPCKRRRLVRPNFVRNELTVDGVKITPSKGDSNSTMAAECQEKVDASIKSIHLPAGCQENVIEGEADSPPQGNGKAENAPDVPEGKVNAAGILVEGNVHAADVLVDGNGNAENAAADIVVEGNGNAEVNQVLDIVVEGNGNAEVDQVSDIEQVQEKGVVESGDNQKLCGWIEW